MYKEHRYRSADGRLDLYARDYPADGPALLLMHGLTRNSADFEPLVSHLSGQYRMIVPDQRGRGKSDYDPDSTLYRPDIYAADMWALLDSLDIDSASLIGTSMGGLMAMIMGAVHPARIRSIVLNDVGPEIMEEGLDRIRGYVGATGPASNWAEAAQRCKAINGDMMDGLGDADWLAFARRTYRQSEDGAIHLAYDPAISEGLSEDQSANVPPDLWPLWDMIAALPLLVIRGEKSDLLAPQTVATMEDHHSGPFVQVSIPGRGHAPLLDEPEALAAIQPFLSAYA